MQETMNDKQGNPILEYWDAIEKGKIRVGKKVRKLYKRLAADVVLDGDYHYSPSRANHAIGFIERFCRHSKGKMGGQLVSLMLWQKALIAAIFGFVDMDGNRRFRRVVLIVGKKNGKSLLASAIGIYAMIADSEPGAEVYAVATTKEQASIIWSEAKRMVRKSPELSAKIKTLVGKMESDWNESTFRPLASDSDTLDGLNIHCALLDEIHQWKSGRALYNIVADGVAAREQPLMLITSTAGMIRGDIYDEIYEECERQINGFEDPDGYRDIQLLPVIYELDERKEWVDPEMWIKANPGLGEIKNLDTLRRKVERAKANPNEVKNLICKEFNIPETSTEAWLTFEEIDNRETFDLAMLRPRYGIGGCDLSKTTDLTAACVIFRVPHDPKLYVSSMYWIAAELVQKKVVEDQIPYDKWIDQGLIRTCPGNSVHPHFVYEWFVEMQETHDIYLPYIGYDAWSAKYWVEEMAGYFGPTAMVPVIQGKKTLSEPMQLLGVAMAAKHVVYNNNPISKWCFANTRADEDKNGNIQPAKTSKSKRRIDGFSALLDAYVVYNNVQAEYSALIGE